VDARLAAEKDAQASRQEAKSRALEVEKLTKERDHLRLALSDAEMDLQTATALLGEVKQGLVGKKEEETALEERMIRRQASLKIQEQLRKAEEVNRVNEGIIRGLEEQLKGVKEGYMKERQVWVKDAIAQQSTIMEHIKDRESYAKTKEKEIKRLTLSVDVAKREAAAHLAEVKRKEEEFRSLAASLEGRDKVSADERAALEIRVKEQTEALTALEEKRKAQAEVIAGFERKVKEQGQVIEALQKEGESAKAQLLVGSQIMESLKNQVVGLGNELRVATARAEGLAENARRGEELSGELKTKVQDLEEKNVELGKALDESEQEYRKAVTQREALRVELKEREEELAAARAEIQKQSGDLQDREAAVARAEVAKIRETVELSERLGREIRKREEVLRAAVAEAEAELRTRIVGLESQVRELEAGLTKSAAEKERLEAEKKELLEVLEAQNGLRGSQEPSQGSLELRERQGMRSTGQEDFLGVLREKEELIGQMTMDVLRQEEEIRTLRRHASENAAGLEAELRGAREEREKMQLKAEFLRKKVGELKEQVGPSSRKGYLKEGGFSTAVISVYDCP
jgi:DNA repair exonuclease SbcCD ATPase subunit